jgi:hypothetical protein
VRRREALAAQLSARIQKQIRIEISTEIESDKRIEKIKYCQQTQRKHKVTLETKRIAVW